MPLITRTGSQDTTSSREQPRNLRSEVQDNIPALDAQSLLDETVINNTFVNNTSFNEDSFKNNRSLVAGFPEGRIIFGTYFSQNSPITDIQSNIADITMDTLDDVHISWTQIRNMELRCNSDFQFEYAEDVNVASNSYDAIVFPGFQARIGDIFLYGMRNGKIGMFYVSAIKRLALGQDTYHAISLILKRWLTAQDRDRFARQTTSIFYFDKEKFLAGNVSLLTSEGFIQKKELKHIRRELIQNYTDRFYSKEMSSFMRPDGIYDPYVVEYWLKKISIQESEVRPIQLLISVQNFKKTIWATLTNNPIKDLKNIERDFSTEKSVSTFWGINVTSLLGHSFLTVGKEEAAARQSLIDDQGKPILVDQSPFTSYNAGPMREISKRRSDEQFAENRHMFYQGFLTERKCAPHQHPVDIPFSCDPSKCVECHEHDKHHFPVHLHKPPFPILSTNELLFIWKRLQHLDNDAFLTDTQLAEFRGYVVWYRTTYPGTLSRSELEEQWRKESGISSDKTLTPEEESGLLEFIDSYRKQFLPVLTNRELEVIWRVNERIDLDATLTEEQLLQLGVLVKKYRDHHGYPPKDGLPIEFPIIGSPITKEEVSSSGGMTYDDIVLFDSPSLTELADLMDGKLPSDYVPTVFYQHHPKPNHHLHCHDICHELCGGKPNCSPKPPVQDKIPTYALSYEFYLGSVIMDPFEQLVYNAITAKEIDPAKTLEAISRYLEWSDEEAFYRHLLAIYLIDKSLYWLMFHS